MLTAVTKRSLASTASAASAASALPALDVEFPGVPKLKPISSKPKPTTKVTTLSNGLRVASEETYQQASTVGLFVHAGSRFEADSNNGISQLMQHMAYKSTENRSSLRIVRDIELIGGSIGASSAREHMVYSADVLRPYTSDAIELIAETIKKPKYAPWDIEEQQKVIGYELENLLKDAQSVVTESLHAAAYGDGNPLGRSLWCPARNLNKLGAKELKAYAKELFIPSRMVLTGAGVDHDEFVKLATKFFGDIPASSNTVATPASPYKGGDVRVRGDSPLTHLAMCFDAGKGWNSSDLLPICVAHMLLGGGSSFSSGGPGKGMYSRLYLRVLNENHWIESCSAFNSMYNDNGLFGIYGTCEPSNADKLANIMADQLLELGKGKAPSDEEISRAKNQLKSSIIMNLESRQVLFEDIGRQILSLGKREDPASLCEKIDKVTASDVQKAVAKILSTPISVAAFGDVSKIPSSDVLGSKFKN